MAAKKQGFLIDMDGVIYSGPDLIPGSDIFIKKLQENEVPFLFLTNNSQLNELFLPDYSVFQ